MIHVHAQYGGSAIETPLGTVPEEIQWMPPGRHKITALNKQTREPLPLEIDVTEVVARLVASQLQYLRAQAAAGNGDLPFIDFNHEDGAASGHPKELYWGGNDPKIGGIRANMEWTGSGRTALLGKDFRRFSPEFAVDPSIPAIAGLCGVNLGGLVNKAAFQTMQAIVAKSAANPLHVFAKPGDNDPAKDPFELRVREMMKKEGIDYDTAKNIVLKNEPGLWIDHLYYALDITREQADRLGITVVAEAMAKAVTVQTESAVVMLIQAKLFEKGGREFHPFTVQAKAMAAAEGIEPSEAAHRVAAKDRALYVSYTRNVMPG